MATQIDLDKYTPEQISRILKSRDAAELDAALQPGHAEQAARQAAVLGAGTIVGRLALPPVTIGHVILLDAVASPFIADSATDDDGQISAADVALAAYILSHGQDLADIISTYAARRARLEHLIETTAADAVRAQAIDRLVDNEAVLGQLRAEAAGLWDGPLSDTSVQEVADAIVQAIADATAPFQRLPADDQKKTPIQTPRNGPRPSSPPPPRNSTSPPQPHSGQNPSPGSATPSSADGGSTATQSRTTQMTSTANDAGSPQ